MAQPMVHTVSHQVPVVQPMAHESGGCRVSFGAAQGVTSLRGEMGSDIAASRMSHTFGRDRNAPADPGRSSARPRARGAKPLRDQLPQPQRSTPARSCASRSCPRRPQKGRSWSRERVPFLVKI